MNREREALDALWSWLPRACPDNLNGDRALLRDMIEQHEKLREAAQSLIARLDAAEPYATETAIEVVRALIEETTDD